ncbi:MAG TPA: FtsX-like permease family protein [Acidimicrobiales bacterium]
MLIGGVGGFVLGAASAARRVDSAYRTLLAEIDAPDAVVIAGCEAPANGTGCVGATGEANNPTAELSDDLTIERLLATGVVEKARVIDYVFPYFVDEDGTPLLGTPENEKGCGDYDGSVVMLAAEGGGGAAQSLPIRLDGELPLRGSDGVVLSHATAERSGLAGGQRVRLAGWCNGDAEITELAAPVDLMVTGLSVGAVDVEPPGATFEIEPAHVDPVVYEALAAAGAENRGEPFVWLQADASPTEISEGLASFEIMLDLRERAASIDEALATDARLLWLLAAIGALGGVLVLAPIIGRNIRDTGPQPAALAAVGAPPPLIAQQAVVHALALAVIGALLAVIIAVPVAAMMPRGLAAAIAPDRELRFDGAVSAIGVLGLVFVVVVIGALTAWRIASGVHPNAAHVSLRGGRTAGWIRLQPAGRTGVLAAVGSPVGPRLASPWPGLVSMVLVATAGVASVTYSAGLRHLEQTPRVVGWNWDATVSFQFGQGDPAQVPEVLERLMQIDGVDQVTPGTAYPPSFLAVPDTEISFVWPSTFATGPQAITPTMLSGRAPAGPYEVAIDPVLAGQTGLTVGETISFGRRPLVAQLDEVIRHGIEEFGIEGLVLPEYEDLLVVERFEITGVAVLPVERSQQIPQAAFTLEGYADLVEPSAEELAVARAWLPESLPPEMKSHVASAIADLETIDELPSHVYMRLSGDAQLTLEAVAAVLGEVELVAPTPEQVLTLIVKLNVERSDRVPIALATTVAALFFALASYLLFASVRARRFELAVLRALGMSTSGIHRSIAAQATALSAVALMVALPVGVLIGRWAWLGYARNLHVLPVSVIPWSTLAIVAGVALAVANLAALTLGWPAARRSPVPDLSSE